MPGSLTKKRSKILETLADLDTRWMTFSEIRGETSTRYSSEYQTIWQRIQTLVKHGLVEQCEDETNPRWYLYRKTRKGLQVERAWKRFEEALGIDEES